MKSFNPAKWGPAFVPPGSTVAPCITMFSPCNHLIPHKQVDKFFKTFCSRRAFLQELAIYDYESPPQGENFLSPPPPLHTHTHTQTHTHTHTQTHINTALKITVKINDNCKFRILFVFALFFFELETRKGRIVQRVYLYIWAAAAHRLAAIEIHSQSFSF